MGCGLKAPESILEPQDVQNDLGLLG